MANLSRNFIAGRMNKGVDERLVPNGEYIDALNVRLGSTEDTEIGSVENAKGNEQLTTLNYKGTLLSSQAKCIGALDDPSTENIYWFVHDPQFADSTVTGKLDLVVSYNTLTQGINYHVISMRKEGSNDQTTLNFDPSYLITGVSIIENLLFFTDNLNQPREIDITKSYDTPNSVTTVDGFTEEEILVIKKPPLYAPEVQLTTVGGEETYMEERFICFAYRYLYANNQYSATSPFSEVAFAPNNFIFSANSFLNEGMLNSFNGAIVTYNTGGELVVGVDILFTEADGNVVKIIEKLNKKDLGLLDNVEASFVFDNSKIFTILPESELLRLYDNVPLQAQAQTIMGNRLMYGNYYEGYDLINCNGGNVVLDYVTELQSLDIGLTELDVSFEQSGYFIDPTAANPYQVPDSKAVIDCSSIAGNLVEGASLSFDISFSHADYTGAATPLGQTQATNLTFFYTLPANFTTIASLVNSDDFQEKIGIGAPNAPTNIETVSNACNGSTFTDAFNCNVANIIDANSQPSWTKYQSGIGLVDQAISVTANGTDIIIQLLAMRRVDDTTNPTASVYEYFEFNTFEVEFQEIGDARSLHSNRDYEIGMIYLDEYARASTALVSPNNTIHIPCENSATKNFIQVTIPSTMKAPEWATHYKFCIKPAEEIYQTIYSNIYFTAPLTNKTYFLLDGENARKVEVGDRFIVKRDSNGPLTNCAYATVLEKGAEERDFLGEDNPPLDSDGNAIKIAQGVYMSIKVQDFSITQDADAFISPGEFDITTSGNDCYPGLAYRGDGVFGRRSDPADPTTYVPFDIPGGSRIRLKMKFKRKGPADGNNKCERRIFDYDKEFTASQFYPNIIEWWEGDNIATSLDDQTLWEVGGGGVGSNVYVGQANTDSGASASCLTSNSLYYDMTPELGTNFFTWFQDADDQITFACTGTRACGSSSKRDSSITMEWFITRAENTIVFETLPSDALPNVWFESSETLNIVTNDDTCSISLSVDQDEPNPIQFDYIDLNGDSATVIVNPSDGVSVIGQCNSASTSSATPPDDPSNITIDYTSIEKCTHLGNVPSSPTKVNTPFFNCYSFGNGVESYRIRDSFEGRSFNLGERVLTTTNESYGRYHRFADITYSGVYNDETNLNNLNNFNLGLLNFKPLEERYGPVRKLAGRQTDLLTLQEDKISYVLTGKNLLSDSAGGGAIASVPEVLGTQIARTEEYGISLNPESYAEFGPNKFFTDSKRGAVIQLKGTGYSNEQLGVISEQNMRSWFRDLFIDNPNTQKLGAFDPYMNEYVLSSNLIEIPTETECISCNVTLEKVITAKGPQTYCVELPQIVGDVTIDVLVNSISANTNVNIQESLTGTTLVLNSTGSGTLTFSKSSAIDNKVDITLSVTQGPNIAGDANIDIKVGCPEAEELTVVQVCLTPYNLIGETIHNEYRWTDGTFISPTTSNFVSFANPIQGQAYAISQFSSLTGEVGLGPIPPDGDTVSVISNKIAPGDTFDFSSSSKLKYLRTDTEYAPTEASINSLMSNPNIVDITPQTPTPPVVTGTFVNPVGTEKYLYLIYDYRTPTQAALCYDANSAQNACCDCSCSEPCNVYDIINTGANIAIIGYRDCEGVDQTFTLTPNSTEEYCSQITPTVVSGNEDFITVTLTFCDCII